MTTDPDDDSAPDGPHADRPPGQQHGGSAAVEAATAEAAESEAAEIEAAQGRPLDDFLPYLVNLITQSIAIHFQKTGRPLGITIERWRVLFVLMHVGGLRASHLSARTGIEASTLSHLLGRMERDGLVTRERDPSDARAVCIDLTTEGRALAERVLPLALQYEKIALTDMSAEEARHLKDTLRRIADNLQALDRHIVPPGPAADDAEEKVRKPRQG